VKVVSSPIAPGGKEREACRSLAEQAREEDLGGAGDITTQACIPPGLTGALEIVARAAGTVCGTLLLDTVLDAFSSELECNVLVPDGVAVSPGTPVAVIEGPVRSLLIVERTVLNFCARLSGIATRTRQFVDAVAGTKAAIYDTRKTTPGWRVLEKYAVRAGGGRNHRGGLYDAVLVKDNHRLVWGVKGGRSLRDLVQHVRRQVGAETFLEVEVDSLDELADVVSAPVDAILLDNFSVPDLRSAVSMRDRLAPGVLLEASGGITLERVREVAETGVERISVGAITHSACWLDVAAELRL